MKKLTTMDMYTLCNENGWFTHGDIEQYERMFDFVKHSYINSLSTRSLESLTKLATMIWICSDPKFTLEEIYEKILAVVTIE